MTLPDRNARLSLPCCFQQNRSHAPQRQISLALRQQRRPHPLPPVRFRHVQRDHVRQRRILLRQNESHDFPAILRHRPVRRRQLQKISQHCFGIRDPRRKTSLVEPQQRRKVPWFVVP